MSHSVLGGQFDVAWSKDGNKFWVNHEHGQISARLNDGRAYVDGLFVSHEHRNRGLATFLGRTAMDLIDQHWKVPTHIAPGNEGLAKKYEEQGFVRTGRMVLDEFPEMVRPARGEPR